jgi:hypothetical protein
MYTFSIHIDIYCSYRKPLAIWFDRSRSRIKIFTLNWSRLKMMQLRNRKTVKNRCIRIGFLIASKQRCKNFDFVGCSIL